MPFFSSVPDDPDKETSQASKLLAISAVVGGVSAGVVLLLNKMLSRDEED